MEHPQARAVVDFYDTHPINEDEILAKLRAAGKNVEALTEGDLSEFDQDHYGGTEVVEAIARAAGLHEGMHVLDVCSGMGGPARWLAWRHGCRVTGLELTASRVAGANRLTARVGLSHLVQFVEGNAVDMPFEAGSFDAVISQESWCHVPDKAGVLAECARVLVPGGVLAFTDIMTIGSLADEDRRKLASGMAMPPPASPADYAVLIRGAGFRLLSDEDLSQAWSQILVGRLEMYRSLRDTTVAKFGLQRYEEYDRAYAHFVSLFVGGHLGGHRIVARRG
jgi:sarcosine/dimethylglycine N-methyltransferase